MMTIIVSLALPLHVNLYRIGWAGIRGVGRCPHPGVKRRVSGHDSVELQGLSCVASAPCWPAALDRLVSGSLWEADDTSSLALSLSKHSLTAPCPRSLVLKQGVPCASRSSKGCAAEPDPEGDRPQPCQGQSSWCKNHPWQHRRIEETSPLPKTLVKPTTAWPAPDLRVLFPPPSHLDSGIKEAPASSFSVGFLHRTYLTRGFRCRSGGPVSRGM